MLPSRRLVTMSGDVFRDEWSIEFDGTDDYIDCSSNFETTLFNAAFSISVWVKPASLTPSSYSYIIGTKQGNDYFHLRHSPGGQLDTIFKEGTTESTNAEPGWGTAGKWHHIVSTISDSKQVMYLDAKEVHSTTTSLTLSGFNQNTNRNLYIGGRNLTGSLSLPYTGKVSDVALYTTFLTASQVRSIYNGGEPYNHMEGVAKTSVLAWYRLGDGAENATGTTIYDESTNTFNGTWSGASSGVTSIQYSGDTP